MEIQCLMAEECRLGDVKLHLHAWPEVGPQAANMVYLSARFFDPEEREGVVEETVWSLDVPEFVFDTKDGRGLPWAVLSPLTSMCRDKSCSSEMPFIENEVFEFTDRAARAAADYYGTDGRCGGVQVLVDIVSGCYEEEETTVCEDVVGEVESVGSNCFVEERDGTDGFEVESARRR